MIKGEKDEECKACQIYSVCAVPYKFNNIKCPCWCCLVKVMCREECILFHNYANNYMSVVRKQKCVPAQEYIDVFFTMRAKRSLKS